MFVKPQCTLDNLSIQGCQRYPAVSDVFPYGCQQLPRVFHGIVNRNEFYSQYPVFDGIEGICQYSKFDLSVSIWLCEGIAIPLNTVKYYMGTRLNWLYMACTDYSFSACFLARPGRCITVLVEIPFI